ncbi:hypothetical protein [Borreliella bavariensis]
MLQLIESVCPLKHEYTLIRNDCYDAITKIRNKKTLLIKMIITIEITQRN